METDVNYSFAIYKGGVVKESSDDIADRLDAIELELAKMDNPTSEKGMILWHEFVSYYKFSNKYYFQLSPKFGFESNQDFTTTQFTPGLTIGLGAKAWDKSNALAKLNIQFRLSQKITGPILQ